MGIDYGARRIGLAVADGEMNIATPLGVILKENDAQAIAEIQIVFKQERVDRVIMGLPLAHNGSETKESFEVRAFAEKLKGEVSVPMAFENEMLTTRMATHAGVRKEDTDAASAALILQSYLDTNHTE